MNKIIIILFATVYIFPQNPAPCREVFLRTTNADNNEIVFIAKTYQSYRWDNYGNLTTGFQEGYITTNGNTPVNEYCTYGFSFNGDCSDPPESIELGRNLYIIFVDGKSASFSYNANGCKFKGDIYITYDYGNDVFYEGGGCQSLGNTLISQNIAYEGTNCLEEYWTHCLTLTASSVNHPKLFWGPYPDESFGVEYYKIYKKKGTSGYSPVHTTTDFEWTDIDEIIITGGHHANEDVCYYKISAYGAPRGIGVETGFTNEVNSRVEGEDPSKRINHLSEINLSFNLSQNYPNPFNSSTEIIYSVAKNTFVELVVFDVLGREIATLVNEEKQAGQYRVLFDASAFTSGIYFYKIQTSDFATSKKMILMQ